MTGSRIYIGIDWSQEKHDVSFLNEEGASVLEFVIKQEVAGYKQLDEKRQQFGVGASECVVGIESAHTLLIDYLWGQGYTQIYVLPPGVVAANRGRNRQSGAKNDRYDSRVIGETLRTDLHKFYPWHPGSETLQAMRVRVKQAEFWTKESTRLANRLQTVLLRYYPAALAVFPSWPTPLVCHFVIAYPTPAAAKGLSLADFKSFAKSHRYPKPRSLPACYERLCAPYPQAQAGLVTAYASEALPLAKALLASLQNEQENLRQLQKLFEQHTDAHLFAALPGVGAWLAPALLVKFGEDRKRFPAPEPLQSLAGTCPVTNQSGKKRSVLFRRSCDHAFRQITQQWARSAVAQSDWAAAYFDELSKRGLTPTHAYRCLANRLLAISWKLWHDKLLFDDAVLLQSRLLRRKPRS
jgi:transposase